MLEISFSKIHNEVARIIAKFAFFDNPMCKRDTTSFYSFIATLIFCLGIFSVVAYPALACVTVTSIIRLPEDTVQIVDEEAIIVWDAKTQTEHFIRRASFKSPARAFGFLVPSPSKPQLAEASDSAFSALQDLTKPEEIWHKKRHYRFSFFAPYLQPAGQKETRSVRLGARMTLSTTPSVNVISRQHVAGYDATVLSANDAPALNRWLKKNGYVSSPYFESWLRPYIEQHWTITAFKVTKLNQKITQAATGSVRMSFHTPRPFFPYREPADQRLPLWKNLAGSHRSLRVLFLGDKRMEGQIGLSNGKRWPSRVMWTDAIASQKLATLPSLLKLESHQLSNNLRMTIFQDWTSPRPGIDDVIFHPAFDQSPIVPPPIVHEEDSEVFIPLDLIGIILVLLTLLWRITNRRGA